MSDLNKIEGDTVDLFTLKVAKIIPGDTTQAKIIATGAVTKPLTVKGVGVTQGAKKLIEAAGGQVQDN